jgi:hypothetical protein
MFHETAPFKASPLQPQPVGFPACQITFDPSQRRIIFSALRVVAFMLAGAAPILAIPVFVFGLVDIRDSALFFVAPTVLLAAGLAVQGSTEAKWAVRGLVAGLIAVTLYDATRFPFVLTGVWPDFIPRFGASVLGASGENLLMGYFWRYLGDGGGMGVFFFMACAVLGIHRGTWLGRHAVALGVGYGIFIWSGLVATVTIPDAGETALFSLTPLITVLSLVGHLVYGAVLGVAYHWAIHRAVPCNLAPASGDSRGSARYPALPRRVPSRLAPAPASRRRLPIERGGVALPWRPGLLPEQLWTPAEVVPVHTSSRVADRPVRP